MIHSHLWGEILWSTRKSQDIPITSRKESFICFLTTWERYLLQLLVASSYLQKKDNPNQVQYIIKSFIDIFEWLLNKLCSILCTGTHKYLCVLMTDILCSVLADPSQFTGCSRFYCPSQLFKSTVKQSQEFLLTATLDIGILEYYNSYLDLFSMQKKCWNLNSTEYSPS